MKELIYLLIGWNIVTFLLMAIDKYKATHGKWRISESFPDHFRSVQIASQAPY